MLNCAFQESSTNLSFVGKMPRCTKYKYNPERRNEHISELKEAVDEIKGDIDEIKGDIDQLRADVDEMKEEFRGQREAGDLNLCTLI